MDFGKLEIDNIKYIYRNENSFNKHTHKYIEKSFNKHTRIERRVSTNTHTHTHTHRKRR